MKRRLKQLIMLLALVMCTMTSKAQVPNLQIAALINFPDTVSTGDHIPVHVIVQNTGNTPYQGPLQIAMAAWGTTTFLYFNSFPIIILPSDTVSLVDTSGFIADSSFFRQGNNVVVVWPYSSQSITYTTTTVNVWYNDLTVGIKEPQAIEHLQAYPNPVKDQLMIHSSSELIEGVRIWSVTGQLMQVSRHEGEADLQLSLQDLAPGYYTVELTSTTKHVSRLKIIVQ